MNKNRKILIVDTDITHVDMLTRTFSNIGMTVFSTDQGEEALKMASELVPDVILMEMVLSDIDGVELCQKLRSSSRFVHTVIIFISSHSETYSQIAGYKVGADDYVLKPINVKVLIEKIEVILNRIGERKDELVKGQISIDSNRFVVISNGSEFVIPRKEFELLSLLMHSPQKVFRREEIMNTLWQRKQVNNRTIDVHIRKLRERFGDGLIRTITGVGYKYNNQI